MKKTLIFICFGLVFCTQDGWALEKRSPKKQCTLCHIRWLDAFTTGETTLVELNDTGILVSGTLSDVTTRRMCLSCHDGYVVDSRISMASENKHHSLKKVPKGFRLPEGFRLNMNQEFYCGTCHGFHDIKADGRIGEAPFVRMPNEYSQMCLACHPDQGEMQKVRNHPTRVELKSPPPPGLLTRYAQFGPDRVVICQSCHAAHSPGVVLATVEDSMLCLFCHADKRRTGTAQDGDPWKHPVNMKPDRDLEKIVAGMDGAKLGAGGKLICSTCHSTHKGVGPYVLVSSGGPAFCGGCHTGEAEALSGTKHDLLKSAPASRNLRGQSPEQSGMCGACHFAHGWSQRVPQGADPVSGACLSCHREGGWAEKETVGTFSHPVNVAPGKKLETGLPLWKLGGEERVVCTTCHDAHRFWPGAQRPVPPFEVDGDPTNSFLRMEADALCRECHPEKELLRNTKHDLTHFGKPLEKQVEQALALGGPCVGCHRSHNAGAGRLWFRPLGDPTGEFDRQEATRRCLSCHADAAMKRIEEERGHSVGREIKAQYMPQPPEQLQLGKLETLSGEVPVLICTTCHLPHGARHSGRDGQPLCRRGTAQAGALRCVSRAQEAGDRVAPRFPHKEGGRIRPGQGQKPRIRRVRRVPRKPQFQDGEEAPVVRDSRAQRERQPGRHVVSLPATTTRESRKSGSSSTLTPGARTSGRFSRKGSRGERSHPRRWRKNSRRLPCSAMNRSSPCGV